MHFDPNVMRNEFYEHVGVFIQNKNAWQQITGLCIFRADAACRHLHDHQPSGMTYAIPKCPSQWKPKITDHLKKNYT